MFGWIILLYDLIFFPITMPRRFIVFLVGLAEKFVQENIIELTHAGGDCSSDDDSSSSSEEDSDCDSSESDSDDECDITKCVSSDSDECDDCDKDSDSY